MQSVESIIQTTIAQLKTIVDVNTIVGQPIHSGGDTLVVPISKVCFGFFSGGGEYAPQGKVARCAQAAEGEGGYPFLGTAVAGVSITPRAFLASTGKEISVIPTDYDCTFDRVVELMPRMIHEIRLAVSCGKEEPKEKNGARQESGQAKTAPLSPEGEEAKA